MARTELNPLTLPATGGVNNEFTASGTILAGDPVSLSSLDGTISTSGISDVTFGSEANIGVTNGSPPGSTASSPSTSVLTYYSGGFKAVAFTQDLNGTITYGTPVTAGTTDGFLDVDYLPGADLFFLSQRSNSTNKYAGGRLVSYSGTTLTLGTQSFPFALPVLGEGKAVYDPVNSTIYGFYRRESTGIAVVQWSHTGLVLSSINGNATETGAGCSGIAATYDTVANLPVIVYKYSTSMRCATFNSSTMEVNSPVDFGTFNGNRNDMVWDENHGQSILLSQQGSATAKLYIITVSGTTPTIAEKLTISNYNGGQFKLAFDASSNKLGVFTVSDTGTPILQIYAVGNGTLVFDEQHTYGTSTDIFEASGVFVSSNSAWTVMYDADTTGYLTNQSAFLGATNYKNFIGFATENIADSEVGTVTTYGNINKNQSGLSAGSKYYLTEGGSLTTSETPVSAGFAISADSILVADVNLPTSYIEQLKVSGNTSSTSTTTGALTVAGGVGIAENLNVGGNVGIGTDNPLAKLHLKSDAANTITAGLFLENAAGGGGNGVAINYLTAGTAQNTAAQIATEDDGAFGYDLYFATKQTGASEGALIERVRITSSGNVEFKHGIQEQQYNLTGTNINPANGTIQYVTLTGNITLTESLADGQYVTLMIDDGAGFTITWPTITWVGGTAPTLVTTGYNVIELWQVNGTVYGAFVGTA